MEDLNMPSISHIGLVVKDAEKTARFYESLGIKPFIRLKLPASSREIHGKTVDSNSISVKLLLAECKGVGVEILQPLSGESIQKEFLDKYGQGVHHIAIQVTDLEKSISEFISRGMKIAYRVTFLPDGGAVYMEAEEAATMIELIQLPTSQNSI
jgi:methylmalonyl-CoA/ethylmalonyl-CoA epimerase